MEVNIVVLILNTVLSLGFVFLWKKDRQGATAYSAAAPNIIFR